MDQHWTHSQRLSAAGIALLALGSLALQTTLNLDRDGSPLVAFALLLRFFTIWSNLAVGLVLGWIALGRRIPEAAMLALVTAICVAGLVYHALLAAQHHPVGLDWWTNQMFHTAIPAATLLWWLASTRNSPPRWQVVPAVLVGPITYTGFALIYGAQTGFYPYFFLDQPTLGWANLALYILGLGAGFLLVGAGLLGLRRLVAARSYRLSTT